MYKKRRARTLPAPWAKSATLFDPDAKTSFLWVWCEGVATPSPHGCPELQSLFPCALRCNFPVSDKTFQYWERPKVWPQSVQTLKTDIKTKEPTLPCAKEVATCRGDGCAAVQPYFVKSLFGSFSKEEAVSVKNERTIPNFSGLSFLKENFWKIFRLKLFEKITGSAKLCCISFLSESKCPV